MFFIFGDSLKAWKKDLKASGADMSQIKSWQKIFDRIRRETPQVEAEYTDVKKKLEIVCILLRNIEMALIEYRKNSLPDSFLKRKLVQLNNGLKKYQDCFHHEFLISKEDTEFYLTYSTLLELCEWEDADNLILQSEIENLIAMTMEALDKEWPDFRALTFYYFQRDDEELLDLPHSDKIEKVTRIYKEEFLEPMRQMMINCYGAEKAMHIMEVDLWN